MNTYEVWLEDRQVLMIIQGKNKTDARENFNDDIRFVLSESNE